MEAGAFAMSKRGLSKKLAEEIIRVKNLEAPQGKEAPPGLVPRRDLKSGYPGSAN